MMDTASLQYAECMLRLFARQSVVYRDEYWKSSLTGSLWLKRKNIGGCLLEVFSLSVYSEKHWTSLAQDLFQSGACHFDLNVQLQGIFLLTVIGQDTGSLGINP